MKILGLVAGAALLLGAQAAHAVTITNGSFENPIVAGNFATYGNGSSSLTGWTIGGDSIDHIGSYWQASNGTQSIDLSGNDAGSISQVLNGLTVGLEYIVSFDMAVNPDGGPTTKLLEVSAGGTSSLYSLDIAGQTKSNMGWVTFTYAFIATATTDTLAFISQTAGGFGPALDNVSIAATPIPGALLLFGSALGGMGFLGYRRRKLAATEA